MGFYPPHSWDQGQIWCIIWTSKNQLWLLVLKVGYSQPFFLKKFSFRPFFILRYIYLCKKKQVMKNLDCIVSTPYIQKWNGGSFAHSHFEVFWHLIIHQTTSNLERNLGVFCFRAVMYQGWRSSLAMKMGWVRFSHGPQFRDSSSIGRAPSFQVGGLQVRVLSIAQLIVLWHFKKNYCPLV